MSREERGGETIKKVELVLPGIETEEVTVAGRLYRYSKPDLLFQEALRATAAWKDYEAHTGAFLLELYSSCLGPLYTADVNLKLANKTEGQMHELKKDPKAQQQTIARMEFEILQAVHTALRSLQSTQRALNKLEIARQMKPG